MICLYGWRPIRLGVSVAGHTGLVLLQYLLSTVAFHHGLVLFLNRTWFT